MDTSQIVRLARLIADARQSGIRLSGLPAELQPATPDEADAVQDATVALLGDTVGGYKVAQVGDGPGSWGAIVASRLLATPAHALVPATGLRIEIEVAFQLARDLPGRQDRTPYTSTEVSDAISGACAAFELIESRLPSEPKPAAVVARADMMSNWGLVFGPLLHDWRAAVHTELPVSLRIDGQTVVAQSGGHPAGDPFHPVVWLANTLVSRGGGLLAGQIVTTGSFGGSHPLPAGACATGSVEGFAPLTFEAQR